MRSFRVEIGGHSYRAAWKLDGNSVEVRSDYGTGWANLNGRDPSEVAREVMRRIVPESRSMR